MIKQWIGAAVQWGIILFFLIIMMIFQYHFIILSLIILWCILPIITVGINFFIKKKIQPQVKITAVTSKKENLEGTVVINNQSIFPVMKLFCKVLVENQLTGEKEELYLPGYAVPKGKSEKRFTICSRYCGCLAVRIESLYLMDWFGLLWIRVKENKKASSIILPETFLAHIFLRLSAIAKEDTEHWSQFKRGKDQSELFGLRDYAEGDSMNQIHWKMSAKKGQIIVKEASLPIEKSLLVFWNKNITPPSAEEMDSMAECFFSLCQGMVQEGISFVLGWTEKKEQVFEYIDNREQLFQIIPRTLKHGYCSEDSFYHNNEGGRYSKVIYFAAELPKEKEPFGCEDTTFFICHHEGKGKLPNIIAFGTKSYREDLAYIEL